MRGLTVLFDQDCALCRRAASLAGTAEDTRSAAFRPGRLPAGPERLYPALDHRATLREMTVIGERGEIYREAKAWLMCLWALRDYREMAIRWSAPERIEYARRFVAWVSRNRFRLSWLIGFH